MKIRTRSGRRLAPLSLALAASLALAGCGLSGAEDSSSEGTAAAKAVLTIGMSSDAESLDPPNFVLAGDFARTALIYETLVKLTNDGKFEPGLATAWKQVSDTVWEFQLREGVTFHDGTPFDSAAVKTSLERAAQQKQGSGFLKMIKTVETPDPLTARLVLSEPFSSILNNLTVPVAAIISPAALTAKGDKISTEPVGTGPYKFSQWVPDTSIVLNKHEGYWGQPAALDTVTFVPIPEASTRFSALQSGDVDVIENPPPSELATIKASKDMYPIIESKARPVFVGFNLKEVPDVKVRKAIAHAIDKEAMVKNVLEGVGRPALEGLVPPEFINNDPPIGLKYDPEESRRLLAEAGAQNLTIDLVLPTERYLKDKEMGEVLQQQLAEIGIKVNLKVQEPGTWYQSLLDHETQMYWLGWGMSSGDPADMLLRVFHSTAVNNMSQYAQKDVDAQIASLSTLEVGSEERNQLMQDIQRRVVEKDVAVVPIYHMSNFYAARSGVQGFHTTTSELLDLSAVKVS
ncbi:ABC transporter substrate-binding protein [Microbispora sp. H11081]|uniref:ABC transporter substrate-binding protein n=1 Tax=Microbispora sp. H11081 TaxID=2729107 RepID=UPI001472A2E1|nr:ABC transporter substrate-binding protein [Microbispora sp. H11081]